MKDQEYNLKAKFDDNFNIIIENINGLKRVLKRLKHAELDVVVKAQSKKRSNRFNRYFWGVVVLTVRQFLLETTGIKYTKDQVYYYLNSEVLDQKPEITIIMGKNVICMKGKSLSQMTNSEFKDSVEKIQEHFALMDCIIPDPKQENFLQDFIN